MLTTSTSPTLLSRSHITSVDPYHSRKRYEDSAHKPPPNSAAVARPQYMPVLDQPGHRPSPRNSTRSCLDAQRRLQEFVATPQNRSGRMVDAGTQYSPPDVKSGSPRTDTQIPTTIPQLANPSRENNSASNGSEPHRGSGGEERGQDSATAAPMLQSQGPPATGDLAHNSVKRSAIDLVKSTQDGGTENGDEPSSPITAKRSRPSDVPIHLMPLQYETCNPRDLVILISSMLMELVRYNDGIPLRDGHLTRFHSRAPPGISVLDYLQRLTTHATLSPPILLSMVYYIDRLCAMYPAFTISSLTVHRFLITSATVASKGLSDSFWTNKTYARVGGVSLKELALLELEFLERVNWRIVPRPEVLVDYYRSLVERSEGYEIDFSSSSHERSEASRDIGVE